MIYKKIFVLFFIFFILFNSALAQEIETEIIGLPDEVFAREEYTFVIEVKNLALFNVTEIKGFIDSDLDSITIKNNIIDIDFLEAGGSKRIEASLISSGAYKNPNIYVIINSYKLNKSRKYRGEEDFDLVEDEKEIIIKEKMGKTKFPIRPIVEVLSVILIVFIASLFFVFKRKRFK